MFNLSLLCLAKKKILKKFCNKLFNKNLKIFNFKHFKQVSILFTILFLK